ncbi:MAG: glycoside hydrolase family 3 C-terminal domain-containing protein [Lachnospiraceae bacterium]|nr:glycoside hydrolase family 3 C-terminal domain-containing protein [Lachnospiraceae bacterium]
MNKIFAPTQESIMQDEKEHMELSRRLAGECVVLLENDGTLPFKDVRKIALFGTGARQTVKGGTGSGDVNSRMIINIEEGLKQAGFKITSEDWLDSREQLITEAKIRHREEIDRMAKETGTNEILLEFANPYREPEMLPLTEKDLDPAADAAVYVISRNSGEGLDRFNREGDYLLTGTEKAHITTLAGFYKKVVLILNIGGVMDLSEVREIEGIGAIVLMSQLGNIGGLAIADILTGAAVPSGKLADTWAASYEDYPSSATFSHNNGDVSDDNYTEGIYVGYRYFEAAGIRPLYGFGYGLSYTTFSLKPVETLVRDGRVIVRTEVTNTGSTYAGKEVVQVYVSAPVTELDKPVRELKGYAKSEELAPGQSACVEVDFPLDVMASFSEKDAAWELEAGDYIVSVGASLEGAEPAAVLRVGQTAKLLKVRNAFKKDVEFEDWKPAQNVRPAAGNVPVIGIPASELKEETAQYSVRKEMHTDRTETLTLQDVLDGKCTVEELTAQLSVREMASLCCGTQRLGMDSSIVGNASNSVPGAAGDTSRICEESRGIRSLIMADGPAGLRLQPHFKARHDGTLLPGGAVFGDAVLPFPEYDHPEDVVDHYQYCTAIPIGWALAQSWNTDIVEQAADMVGAEMEKFGVDIWLAPAMNIHRNPLCGRNFEYYSEDPVLTGRTAAAITRGVQAHPGRGVSVKHFAANNQEDDRYHTNAHVSERAMREIYLRGFEICIRETQPMTIMSSYNLINGIHTANSYELLQQIARDEWGFEGSVMTDWYSTTGLEGLTGDEGAKYPVGSIVGSIYAGNDIQMPGDQRVEDTIAASVEEGISDQGFTATLADLQFCTANVIRSVIFAAVQSPCCLR